MGFFDLVLQTGTSLHPYEEPNDFISEYTGRVRYERERDGRVFTVGKVHAYRLHAGLALDHGESLFAVCDSHSQAMHDLYAAFYDAKTDHFTDAVAERFDAVEPNCLVLDYVVLHPRWRGLKLGLLAVRKLVDVLGGGCGLALSEILPLNPDADSLGVPAVWLPRHDTEGALASAKRSLRRYFKRMGFRRVGRTAYYALSLARKMPTDRDLLNPPK
jgi:hypothetical protein